MISIIIPVLNEAEHIEESLAHFKALSGESELIVVDGGSVDHTVAVARRAGALVVSSSAGRAAQLNRGAEVAQAEILWFVHIDSKVDMRSLSAIQQAIEAGASYGCFSLYFYDSDHVFMRFIALSSRLRARLGRWIFGDQGIFVSRDFFKQLDGFPPLAIMEDLEFSRRARRLAKPVVLAEAIGTSARRFEQGGILRTFFMMQRLKFDYLCGVDTEQLRKRY